MSAATWKHDDLAVDLAAHLRGYSRPAMVWLDMQLGPVGSPRPDVYTIEPTYQRISAMAYECKISRSDFLADVTAGKALRYLQYAGALVFATPKGLVRKDELPKGAGLIERGEAGWRWVKKPTINPIQTLPMQAWMKLLIDGCGREQGAGVTPGPRKASQWHHEDRVRKMLGEELGSLLRSRESAKYQLQQEIEKLQQERKRTADEIRNTLDRRAAEARKELAEVEAAIAETAKALGLEEGATGWQIKRALTDLRPEGDRKQLQDAAAMLRRHAEWQLREAGELEQRLGITTTEETAS